MLQVVTADNPSPLTGPGTNSFVLGGAAEVVVIDPGPDDPRHCAALLAAIGRRRLAAILLTHLHVDHSAGAAALKAATGAPIWGFGPPDAGRSERMQALVAEGVAPGGEGVDRATRLDRQIADGALLEGEGWRLRAVHTPGHFAGHLAYLLDDQLICGDLILGWSSTLIAPPDGDLSDYMRALRRVTALAPRRLLPAHGAPVEDPAARIAELAAHRRTRTAEILAALAKGAATPEALAARIYDVPPALRPSAARSVLAHLLALEELGAATCTDQRRWTFARSF